MEAPTLNLHQDLIDRCLAGERSAQHALYQQYARAMYNVALRIVGDADDAQDALQEAFIRAFAKLHTYNGTSTFGAWLKRIVINQALTLVKQRKGEELMDDTVPEPMEEAPEWPGEEGYAIEQVKKAVAALPDGFRSVFSLYLLEGYDHREIAEILDITESTSKSQLNRAKKKVVDYLKEYKVYGTHG